MKSMLTVEFTARAGDVEFKEESVTFHSPEELFEFVAPGGGCDSIPNEVSEIQLLFLPTHYSETVTTLSDKPVTLQLGMVLFNGPLSEIIQVAQQLIEKAEHNELSDSFLTVIGQKH